MQQEASGNPILSPAWCADTRRGSVWICSLEPWALVTSALLALLGLLYLVTRGLTALLRSRWTSREFIGAARAAQRELRARLPASFPATPHTLSKIAQGSSAPVACTVCLVPVSTGQDGLFCLCCGTVCHVGCKRQLKNACKPITLPAGKPAYHDWRPAGTTRPFVNGSSGQNSHEDLQVTESECCIYCSEPCEVGLISLEPVWVCSYCHSLAHTQCFVERHPSLFSAATRTRLQKQLQGLDSGDSGLWEPDSGPHTFTSGGLGAHNHRGTHRGSGSSGSKSRDGKRTSIDGKGSSSPRMDRRGPGGSGGGGDSQVLRRRSSRRVGSNSGSAKQNGHSANHHNHNSNNNPEGGTDHGGLHGSGCLHGAEEHLEVCHMGPAARCCVPPQCVQVLDDSTALQPHRTSLLPRQGSGGEMLVGMAQRAAAAVTHAAKRKWSRRSRSATDASHSPHTPGDTSHSQSHTLTERPSEDRITEGEASEPQSGSTQVGGMLPMTLSADTGVGSGKGGGGVSGGEHGVVSRKRTTFHTSWWQSAGSNRWAGYKLRDEWPANVKPLLVFINLKSGPQLGRTLLLQLFQLLHPLQVVELPREDPIHALRFFAPAYPHVRVLVMGGDGTVGWVLQVIDKVAQEQGEGWAAPPVAIMPMGTGNDLARCLGWGSGVRLDSGLVGCLLEVVGHTAHPVPLDRWTVTITRPVRSSALEPSPGATRGLTRFIHTTRHSVVAVAGGGGASPAAPAVPTTAATCKTLTNYLGIGIDARVALQFHQARTAFPYWFQSQLGNKVWYTGLGAPDLLRRSCVDLYRKLTLECDGVRVPVPSDAQGLVIINIPCHMGGVYLWETGVAAPPVPMSEDTSTEMEERAAALTTNKRMGVADGLIEVVAIGGVAHMGRLAVGLARAQRLVQCSRVTVTCHTTLPMQVDGEPWEQEPCVLNVTHKNQVMMLRRVGGGAAQRVVAAVTEALDDTLTQGLITATQKAAIAREVGKRLEAVLS